jgi:hypothetical protein
VARGTALTADALWAAAAARIRAARGWSLEPTARLGRPRDNRRTWLATGEPGEVIVKALASPSAADRVVAIAGEDGLRCTVAYGAVARLGLAAQRHRPAELATWRRVTDAILDSILDA